MHLRGFRLRCLHRKPTNCRGTRPCPPTGPLVRAHCAFPVARARRPHLRGARSVPSGSRPAAASPDPTREPQGPRRRAECQPGRLPRLAGRAAARGRPLRRAHDGQVSAGLLSTRATPRTTRRSSSRPASPFAQLGRRSTQFESTFGIRQITSHGRHVQPGRRPAGSTASQASFGDQSGQTGQLTATGQQAFPYLKGPVPMDPFSFGFSAVPRSGDVPRRW